jgi:mRNA-degrading endonuclease RelE of RelBE toxin-antitoxin system
LIVPYAVRFKPSAEQALGQLDRTIVRRLRPKILPDLYCIRADYRVVYRIDDGAELVEILIVAHRREVYRDL